MPLITKLKILLLKRSSIIALSISVLAVVGFGLKFHLPAILLSTLLFAGGYLLESTPNGN